MDRLFKLCEMIRFSGDRPADDEADGASERAAEWGARMRSEALRATPTLTPELYRVVDDACRRLGMTRLPEVYVVNDPRTSAAVPAFGREQSPAIALTSGLVGLMTPAEIGFVVGHELGHYGLGHPPTLLDAYPTSEYEALRVRSVQRCAEISADRAGMAAVGSLVTCAMVMVKLVSGLGAGHVVLDVRGFLDQLNRPGGAPAPEWESFAGHPSLPLRLKALIAFGGSDVYAALAGTGSGGRPIAEVDEQVQGWLDELGSAVLTDSQTRQVDLAAAWLGASLVLQDGIVTAHERKMLRSLVGEDLAAKVLSFGEDLGVAAIQEKLAAAANDLAAGEPCVRRRLAAVFRAFAVRLGIRPERTLAWKALPQPLRRGLREGEGAAPN